MDPTGPREPATTLSSAAPSQPDQSSVDDSLASWGHDALMLDDQSLARLARTYVTRHCTRLGGAADLAAMLGVSEARVETVYVLEYGETPSAAITREKFRFAERLLAESSVTLAEIARMIGYEHPADFALAFSRYVGVSPWSFRHLPYHEQIELIGRLGK
ncbi:helix-turn-helix domain-containing protein [Pusillimonas sp. TS35]|uniref:helix-turn-helix domain-containing protein n=1 Tax=Paracandidimonas lactea TaxID=2895524 RepID=UPI00136D0A6C|nr:AraC family transcriptional regulator [Paracandidimonas lactea]MYN14861.1 helix-turn-helix domain-containing protein [Pusillimonas sp. TS35]